MESGGAVSVTTGVTGPLIAKLTTLMGDETQEGVRRDMLFLRDEWRSINALLIKLAAGAWEEGERVKICRRMLRELSFYMDDSIDLVLAGGHAPKSAGSRCLQMVRQPAGHQMATLMRELKAMLTKVTNIYEFRYIVDEPRVPRQIVLYNGVNPVPVGIDTHRQELAARLIDGDGRFKVISVVGLAGSGKTTLAKLVYQTLQEQFECHATVWVSPDPDMKKILLSLLSDVGAAEMDDDPRSEWDLSRLFYALREFLSAKRYLILIDDLWSTQAWRIIKTALPENSLGSRILTTTQIASVAKSCSHPNDNLVYEMKPLSADDATKLLFRTVFGNEDSCPSQLEQVAADIVQKCEGSPLAIGSISTLLVTGDLAELKEKWFHIRDSIQLGFRHRGLDVCEMRSVITSYMELPLQLRTCLLYLIMFPEGYIIHRDWLIKRWIAEGFISAKRGQSLQSVGERYYSELINRKMIQPLNNQADACIVHRTILDIIAHISTEENFVTLCAGNKEDFSPRHEVRRLIIVNYWGERPPSGDWTHKVRSLGIFGSLSGIPPLSEFGALRVLDMEIDRESERYYYLEDIAQAIGHLFHLKYLRLRTTSNFSLVKIAKLQNLETLDLTGTPISELPANIVQLKRLKHLLVNDAKLPDGIRNMQCLSELSRVIVDSRNSAYSLEELGSLTKLSVLGLNWCISDRDRQMETYVDNLVSSLNRLSRCNLQSLRIASDGGCSMDFLVDSWSPPPSLQEFQMNTKYCLPRIPEWMASHSNIAFLDINIDSVEQQVLQILGALPALLVLLLASKKSPSPGLGLRIGSDEFYCLQRLNFTCWNSWGVVMFEAGAMPQLKTLELVLSAKGRQAYDGFDFGVENLTLLKHLCVKVNDRGATALEVEAAEAAVQRAADRLPYRPATEVTRWSEEHRGSWTMSKMWSMNR